MTSIKLAFFDIDGTLIGTNGTYTQRTKNAIALLHENGIKTAIASGRPPFAAQFLFDGLEIKDAGLFFAGAAIYDPVQSKYLKTIFVNKPISESGDSNHLLGKISDKQLVKLISTVKEKQLYCEVYTKDSFYTEDNSSDIYQAHSAVLRVKATVARLTDIVENYPVVKLLLGANKHNFDLARIESDFPDYDFAYAKMASHPDWIFASVTSPLSCRKNGFRELCEYHNVSAEEVIAFGDAQSDHIFIENAGIGVAMADAPETLKESANIVTDTADNDGVAKVIERLVG